MKKLLLLSVLAAFIFVVPSVQAQDWQRQGWGQRGQHHYQHNNRHRQMQWNNQRQHQRWGHNQHDRGPRQHQQGWNNNHRGNGNHRGFYQARNFSPVWGGF